MSLVRLSASGLNFLFPTYVSLILQTVVIPTSCTPFLIVSSYSSWSSSRLDDFLMENGLNVSYSNLVNRLRLSAMSIRSRISEMISCTHIWGYLVRDFIVKDLIVCIFDLDSSASRTQPCSFNWVQGSQIPLYYLLLGPSIYSYCFQ